MAVNITLISDTHGKHYELTPDLQEGGDIIILSGDCMSSGTSLVELNDFYNWFSDLPFTHKIMIGGNHDRLLQYDNIYEPINYKGIIYLKDKLVVVEGLKIYGSPWTPRFGSWAFLYERGGEQAVNIWNKIPDNIDILITHGPPKGILDISGHPYNEPDLGCNVLLNRVLEVKPKIHVFGHIHGSGGQIEEHEGIKFINAAVRNERYEYVHKPIKIQL